MIKHDIAAEGAQQLVIRLRCEAFEKAVLFTVLAYAVNYIAAVQIFPDHLVNRIDVVLKVSVDRYGNISCVSDCHQPGEERVLVAAVPAELNACENAVVEAEFFYNAPRPVARAIIHEYDSAACGNITVFGENPDFQGEAARRLPQDFFLVIARNYNKKRIVQFKPPLSESIVILPWNILSKSIRRRKQFILESDNSVC